jgi:hypothetical protein
MIISLIILILLINMMLLYIFKDRSKIGPEQPIHFSHRVHVNDKHISCFMCHEGAIDTKQADIPPLQTCMLCHDRIIPNHPEIQKLHEYYLKNKPLVWKRVNEKLPDFVFFNHSVHVFRKIDCGACHGNIKEMDRVEQVHEFTMGMCIKCHQEQKASTDCYTCHR